MHSSLATPLRRLLLATVGRQSLIVDHTHRRRSSRLTRATACADARHSTAIRLVTNDCSPKLESLDYRADPLADNMLIHHCDACSIRFESSSGHSDVHCRIDNAEHAELCGCRILLPARVSLDLVCDGDADATMSGLEFQRCRIRAGEGLCQLSDVRCDAAFDFDCAGSLITRGELTGGHEATLKTRGFIRNLGRIQGDRIRMRAEQSIECKSIVAKTASLRAVGGAIAMGYANCATLTASTTDGDIRIDSHDGDVETHCKSGRTSIGVWNGANASLQSESGDISIGLSELLSDVQFDLHSNAGITVAGFPEITTTSWTGRWGNSRDGCIVRIVSDRGRISVSQSSWLSAVLK